MSQHGDGEYYILAQVQGTQLRWPECNQSGVAEQTCATQTVIVVADY